MLAGSSASDGTLTVGAARYRALLLTDWHAADPEVVLAARAAAEAGVPVIVVSPALDPSGSDCGAVTTAHREAENGHLFLVFQEGTNDCTVSAAANVVARDVRLLDPGESRAIEGGRIAFALPAQRPRVLWVRP